MADFVIIKNSGHIYGYLDFMGRKRMSESLATEMRRIKITKMEDDKVRELGLDFFLKYYNKEIEEVKKQVIAERGYE